MLRTHFFFFPRRVNVTWPPADRLPPHARGNRILISGGMNRQSSPADFRRSFAALLVEQRGPRAPPRKEQSWECHIGHSSSGVDVSGVSVVRLRFTFSYTHVGGTARQKAPLSVPTATISSSVGKTCSVAHARQRDPGSCRPIQGSDGTNSGICAGTSMKSNVSLLQRALAFPARLAMADAIAMSLHLPASDDLLVLHRLRGTSLSSSRSAETPEIDKRQEVSQIALLDEKAARDRFPGTNDFSTRGLPHPVLLFHANYFARPIIAKAEGTWVRNFARSSTSPRRDRPTPTITGSTADSKKPVSYETIDYLITRSAKLSHSSRFAPADKSSCGSIPQRRR